MFNSPWLVYFIVGLVDSILYLANNEQVIFFFAVKFEEMRTVKEQIIVSFNLLYDPENYFIVICQEQANSSSNFNLDWSSN